MLSRLKQFADDFNKPKYWLVLANIFLVFFLIILNNLKVIPLHFGDLIFFSVLILAFCLYRPGWAFLFFIGTIPLENINLAPAEFGLSLRPYQMIGFLLIFALVTRFFTRRLNFDLPKLKRPDYFVILLAISGFLSTIAAPDKIASLKLSVILASFAGLYFLTRIYIQNLDDLKKVVPFILSSGFIVSLYGVWQNWRFMHGANGFEFMPGRPNGTFTEPDWLGAFVVVLICIVYGLIFYFNFEENENEFKIQNAKFKISIQNLKLSFPYAFLVILYILLVMTVSRSAWLAALASYAIFIWIFFTDLKFKNWRWKETSFLKIKIISALLVSLIIIHFFHLTNFQLGNRLQSTGTGLQKITISCQPSHSCINEQSVISMAALTPCGCRQINLEDISYENGQGNLVMEVYRKDPNVSIRGDIYAKSWQEIKDHPILGMGWGNIGQVLGKDGNGNYLNTSNIFLETWLGAGILGILSLVLLFGYMIFTAFINFIRSNDHLKKSYLLFVIVSFFGIVISNLFNAGIFLGFLWVWLGINVSLLNNE